jgi:DNA-binding GntR family transcriptional regulator
MLPWLNLPSLTADPLAQVRDTSLGSLIKDEVLRQIMGGQLQVGSRINEPDVAGKLGVSRVPVREALRELASSGLVESRKNSGVFVRKLSERELDELYDLRGLLDAYAGQLAAARITEDELIQLRSSLVAMRQFAEAKNVQGYYQENLRFHWLIVQASGNEQLGIQYQSLVQRLHLARLVNLSQAAGISASIAEHAEILQALQARQASKAHKLLSAHVHRARKRRNVPLNPVNPN